MISGVGEHPPDNFLGLKVRKYRKYWCFRDMSLRESTFRCSLHLFSSALTATSIADVWTWQNEINLLSLTPTPPPLPGGKGGSQQPPGGGSQQGRA